MRLIILGENKSVHVQKWIKALALIKGMELHIISNLKGFEVENVQYYYLKQYTKSKLNYLLNVFFVRKTIRKIKPDIIHAHYATSYGFLGALSGFHPYIITGWGADIFDSPSNFLMKKIVQFSFKKADAISVLSKITKREMLQLSSKNVELIPFGVDTSKFESIPKIDTGIIKIGTVRTLAEKYGLEYLIKAFAILYPKYPNIYLEIIGDGPQKDFLVELTIKLKIADRVTFHGFINQNTDFEKYLSILNSFDIFTILSIIDSETFGVAAVEASACKIPVVATNVGGLPEVIDNDITGILVPPKNAEATALALEKLILSKELRETLGANGFEKVIREYDWQKNVEKMVLLYQSTIKNVSLK